MQRRASSSAAALSSEVRTFSTSSVSESDSTPIFDRRRSSEFVMILAAGGAERQLEAPRSVAPSPQLANIAGRVIHFPNPPTRHRISGKGRTNDTFSMGSYFERPDNRPEVRHDDAGTAAAHDAVSPEWHDLSKEERERLRQELVKAPMLDFQRYLSDIDYQLHIFENPAMQQVEDDIIAGALMRIESEMADLSLSSEQMHKIIAIFEPGVRRRIAEVQEVESEMRPLIRRATEGPEDNHPGTSTDEQASDPQDVPSG